MKRTTIAILLSLLGPGLGQIYNKDYKKGIILIALSAALFLLPLIWIVTKVGPRLPNPKDGAITQEMVQPLILEAVGEGKHILNIISFTFIGVWAYAITQSYFKSKELNEKDHPLEKGSE